ncbi:beta-catenin-like protein-like protein 1 [Saccharata proteae CBS 121410]|uniref:Beta-catenin-like protein-like protein 1 n=1 Tax=Saccharata proteae CBS 121410 TaxID=1314787 RepID=A0A9P4M2L3_9PEZI|nr:beta-catenin-like protein-like protein 1 [Saccharata proteae CBS 121410]
MTSIDDLFKKPNLPTNKRKIEPLTDPSQVYKSAKLSTNGDAKGKGRATVEDEVVEDDDMEAGPSMPPEDEDEADFGPDDDEEGRFFGGGMDANTESALNYLDEADKDPYVPEKMDLPWLRKLALNFEKRISKNAELRAKYETDPSKFMASEADLDSDIKALSILSEHPELYSEFAKMGCAGSLVGLLAHENTDIAIDAIEIISELTDEDVEAEQEQWDSLVNAMVEADLLSLLISNFERFDESIDADRNGVYHSLVIIENLASQISVANTIGQETKTLEWLVQRASRKESQVSQNKQYAAELLAVLVQASTPNRNRLISEYDGVDALLQLIAAYRKRDPSKDTEEEEYAENVFDALTCLVEEPAGKAKFVEAEGVELALIMLQSAKFAKPRVLRLLDHAVSGSAGTQVCEQFVEAGGLKTLFGMFMKKQDNSTTEHLVGILASLLRSLPGESDGRIRTLAKFSEKNYQKTERLIQLRREYLARAAAVDVEGLPEDEAFSRRLDAGLFCLQMIDVILAWLVAEDPSAKPRIVAMLGERDEGLSDVKKTLKEQLDGIDSQELSEEETLLKEMLATLMEYL